jgi:hypothetical protein
VSIVHAEIATSATSGAARQRAAKQSAAARRYRVPDLFDTQLIRFLGSARPLIAPTTIQE